MGLHYHLKYLVTIFVTHVILHCFAVDLGRNNFRRLQHSQVIREKDQYSLNNADGTNTTPLSKGSYISLIPHYVSKSSTPSYIEFDYLNENQSQNYTGMKSLQRFVTYKGMTKVNHFKTSREPFLVPSIISYHHVKDPYMRQEFTPTQKAFFSKYPQKPLYSYFQPFNNTEIDKMGKLKHKLSVKDSISNIPLLGRKEYTEKEFFKSSRVPIRTSISDPISNMALGRKAPTVKAYFKNSRVPTRTSMSTQTINVPILSRIAATVKSNLKSSRVPTRRTIESAPKLLVQFTPSTLITVSTAPDDRVKFFEMYDTNTLKPPKRIKLNESNKIETQLNDIMSEKIEQNGHRYNNFGRFDNTNATKMATTHNYKIRRSNKGESKSAISNQIQGKHDRKSFPMSIVNNTVMFPSESIFSKSEIMTKTAVVPWSSYPFVSVYVYKPTQTHCDAAGISPHWLLAAGSCLSRHTLVPSLHAESAFVTYCGEHWRKPQRIAYVKRSVVHPEFNPKDQVRRLLYNIGLIQVTDSMDACPRWSPVAVMSHQFLTQPGGSVASAVGWGLDRYGTKYMTEKLPHWPLTVYDALVYHDTCPGSSAYSMAKRQVGDGTSNIYCLLLPPYTKEESDPVHGGLLLVEGKLVALYLQEERRPWGPQSAQYTGVWRLLPWVMEVAHEPDDGEVDFDV